MVWAPRIPNFKCRCMRNLQYEKRICPKSHNKVKCMYGSNFYASDITNQKKPGAVSCPLADLAFRLPVLFQNDGSSSIIISHQLS